MNPLTRNILIGGMLFVLMALIGGFALWVMPVESQISTLTTQLEQSKGDKLRSETALKTLEASNGIIQQQLEQLALFDLRNEDHPENLLESRSNFGLIALSEIFQRASISIIALQPVKPENWPLSMASGSPPIASVQKQKFFIHATGLYKNVLIAMEGLRKLPPTVSMSKYTIKYVEKKGVEAKVDLTMDLSFNFLTKPSTASADGGSSGSAFDQMMKNLGGKSGLAPDAGPRVGSLKKGNAAFSEVAPAWRAALSRIAEWLDPPALAATARLEVSAGAIRVVPDGPITMRTFTLKDGRTVVDMPGVHVGTKRMIRVDRGGVRAVRFAQFSTHPLVGRLVVETTGGRVWPRKGANGSIIVPLPIGMEPGAASALARFVVDRGRVFPLPRNAHPLESTSMSALQQREVGPRVRATPAPVPLNTAVVPPQPAPEPEPIIRRVAVRPWREGEIRRIAVTQWQDSEIRRVEIRPEITIFEPALAPVLVKGADSWNVVPGSGIGMFKVAIEPPPVPGGAAADPLTAAMAQASAGAEPPAIGGGRKSFNNIPINREMPVGRAEPFFPLIDATADELVIVPDIDAASGSTDSLAASGSGIPSIALTPPPPIPIVRPIYQSPTPPTRYTISLRGVMKAGNRATALMDVNGVTFVRCSVGEDIEGAPNYRVRAIGNDFVLISGPYGTERKELVRAWSSSGGYNTLLQPPPQAPAVVPGGAPGVSALTEVNAPTPQQVPAPPPVSR